MHSAGTEQIGHIARPNIAALNERCDCLPLYREPVDQQIIERLKQPNSAALLAARPYLFADTPVLIDSQAQRDMLAQMKAIETIALRPDYIAGISRRDPDKFRRRPARGRGMLMSYDFHLDGETPRLIEINTNAGGIFLVKEMLAASEQLAMCCNGTQVDHNDEVERAIMAMIGKEWALHGGDGLPRTLAIVDADPQSQYLYPEMLLAVELFRRHGIDTRIVPVEQLSRSGDKLSHGDWPIDFVYNRLTDFSLTKPAHQAIHRAWREGLAVISPAPEHHAIYADKRNLAILKAYAENDQTAEHTATRRALAQLLESRPLNDQTASNLWAKRKQLFFKPYGGYGAKAAYSGRKITAKVWQQINRGGYVAQTLVEPAKRIVGRASSANLMRYDVRIYSYAGEPLVSAARLYHGQTTNFRTPGGGFAPVVVLP